MAAVFTALERAKIAMSVHVFSCVLKHVYVYII
jgi:hypothetical protein